MAAIAIICTIVPIGTVSVLPLLPVEKQRAGFLPPVVSFGYPKMGIAIPVSYPKMGIVFRKIILHYPHNGATSDTISRFEGATLEQVAKTAFSTVLCDSRYAMSFALSIYLSSV